MEYVYGVRSTGPEELELEGVEGSPVRTVEHDGLAALASALHDAKLTARDLRAHWRVLTCAFEQGTAVLPLRFGTVMESEDAVRERLLAPHAEHLSELLKQMEGLVQLNVKGRYREDEVLREVVRASPAIAGLRRRLRGLPTGASPAEQFKLGQLVEAHVAQLRDQDGGRALERLAPAAVTVRAEDTAYPDVFNLAFLVQRSAVDRFGSAVSTLRGELGDRVDLRYVGPLPPFSFAETNLSLEGAGWA